MLLIAGSAQPWPNPPGREVRSRLLACRPVADRRRLPPITAGLREDPLGRAGVGDAAGNGRAEGEKRGGDLLDDRDHVGVIRVEALGDRGALRTPFDGVTADLAFTRVQETARVGVVVGGS